MKLKRKIFYVGMITTDTYGEIVGEKTYSGAAARKMFSVVSALRRNGHRAIVVSLPFIGTRARKRFYSAVLSVHGRSPVVFLATLRSKYLRKLFSPLFLAAFVWQHVTRRDCVILYNHAIEYIPALVVLWLMGVKVVQDIEDAPTADEGGVRGVLNRLSFAMTFALTQARKMVVAEHVAQTLNLREYVVVRGVASYHGKSSRRFERSKWQDLKSGDALKLHYGGTLIPETGVDLFCEAVQLLIRREGCLACHVVFKVTGIGDIEKIEALQNKLDAMSKVRIELYPALHSDEYIALIDECHASLSLKRPGTGMSNTTFPSKVIEITAAGLALISTRLGDVVSIFDDESAFFLREYNATELVNIIIRIAEAPVQVEWVAKSGYKVCTRNFSEEAVAQQMAILIADP